MGCSCLGRGVAPDIGPGVETDRHAADRAGLQGLSSASPRAVRQRLPAQPIEVGREASKRGGDASAELDIVDI
jgi:hypothetical protein